VWERDTTATTEAAVASAEEDGSRGALLGLRRAWHLYVVSTAELKLKKKVVLRQECRKAQPVLLQRKRWLPAEKDPLQRGEDVF
jgi:hypothetical protein